MLVVSAMAGLGITGEPRASERYDQKQVVVAPADPDDPTSDALRVREVIDQDFANEERRGHERFVPLDFGEPVDVTASSESAPDDVSTTVIGGEFRIRIGDPDVTITGRHLYELAFTYPEARLTTGRLGLDVIGTEETVETGRFEVVVTGLELADPVCSVGAAGATGGCTLVDDGSVYRAVIEPLAAGRGITIGGDVVGRRPVVEIPAPPRPEPREVPDRRGLLAALSLPLGAIGAFGVFRWFSRLGRNEVHGGGGAADAAFGDLPPPGRPQDDPRSASGTTELTDRALDDLATTEFVPPPGLEPWQGTVLLREVIDEQSVSAWFSGLVGSEVLELEPTGKKKLDLSPGRRYDEIDTETRTVLGPLFVDGPTRELGSYDTTFAEAWRRARKLQEDQVAGSGWWTRFGPGNSGIRGRSMVNLIALLGGTASIGLVAAAIVGLVPNLVLALALALVVPAAAAIAAYARLLPARSPSGSALALRTESFRRFLDASEGQHVDWAWERGVLREYTAWAVALGAADAWSKALERSSVVPDDPSFTRPLLFATMASTISSAHTQPSSSGSGGFSGGSVGGGGGGGRSGSW